MDYNKLKVLTGIAGICLFLSVVLAGWREHQIVEKYRVGAEDSALPRPLTASEKNGQKLYHERQCVLCHGENGIGGVSNFNSRGDGKISALRDVAKDFTRDELKATILKGVSDVEIQDVSLPKPPVRMPPYKNSLTKVELEELVDFLWALTPPNDKAREEEPR